MTLSLILTVNNRLPDVSKQVASSLRLAGNHPDELVVVLDRPTVVVRLGAIAAYRNMPFPVKFVEIEGKPEWLGPARAWNLGFKEATGDLLYCISSEVVQDQGNVENAREICKDLGTVVFGACHNSTPEKLVVGAEPGLLINSKMTRPLGFIVCMPSSRVEEIGGFDEKFMDGFWYDDDDFFLRLWRTGLNFIFEDLIHGIHLDHERPDLATPEGERKILVNASYMLKKHGNERPWNELVKIVEFGEGRTTWKHI